MFKAGFDWSRVTWGRPDSPPTVLCSFCSAVIRDDEVPLIIWNQGSFSARFCERCMVEHMSFEPRQPAGARPTKGGDEDDQ